MHPEFCELQRRRKSKRYWANCEAERERSRLAYQVRRKRILSDRNRRRENARRFRLRHPDYVKKWRSKHTELARAEGHRYRAKKAAAPGRHTVSQWLARVQYHGWKCRYCRKLLTVTTLTLDHGIPLSRGDSEWPSNLVPACRSCNSRKNKKTFMEVQHFRGKSRAE